jgi:hypothetical protein
MQLKANFLFKIVQQAENKYDIYFKKRKKKEINNYF